MDNLEPISREKKRFRVDEILLLLVLTMVLGSLLFTEPTITGYAVYGPNSSNYTGNMINGSAYLDNLSIGINESSYVDNLSIDEFVSKDTVIIEDSNVSDVESIVSNESSEESEEEILSTKEISLAVKNAKGKELDAEIEVIKTLRKGKSKVKVSPKDHPIKEIVFSDLGVDENTAENIKIDDVPEEEEFSSFVEVYAIDPTNLDFTNATVTVVATGTNLFKCKDWNFEQQECYGEWVLFKTGLIPGEEYTFILTPDDPGFAETGIYTPTAAADVGSAGTATVAQVNASDGVTTTYNLPKGSVFVETVYHEYNFSINYPSNLTLNTVNISIEWYATLAGGEKLEVYKASTDQWFDVTLTTTVIEVNESVAVGGFINTSYDLNNLVVRFLGYAGGANKIAYIDYLRVDLDASDNLAPVTTLVTPAQGFYNDTDSPADVTFNCSATDNDIISNISLYITNATNQSFALNETRPVTGSSAWANFTLSLENGDYAWNCLAYDDSGNSDWADANRSLTINLTGDFTAPTVTLNTPVNDYNTSSDWINFNWTAIDNYDTNLTCNLTVKGSINASDIASLNNTPTNYSVAGFDHGTHYWNVTCVDDFDNTATSATNYFNVDAIGPTVTIANPKVKTYNTKNLGLSATAEDNLSVAECWYSLNAGSNTSYACETNVDITAVEGTNNLIVYANDTLGNIGYSDLQFNVNTSLVLDISITYPANNTLTNDPTPSITLLAIDKLYSAINYTIYIYYANNTLYSIGNTGLLSNNTPTTIDLIPALSLPDDHSSVGYKVIVTATDGLNQANSSEVNILLTSPLTELISPAYGYYDDDGNINFTFVYHADSFPTANCSLYINDIYNQSNETTTEHIETTFVVTGINEGLNQNWTVNCTMDGIHAEDTSIFHVDATKPAVVLNVPVEDYNTTDTLINFNWTAADNLDTSLLCNLTVDSVVNSSSITSANGTATNYSVANFNDGTHYWNVTCIDEGSNVNTSETRSFTVDTTGPSVTLNTPVNDDTITSTLVNFNWTASNGADISLDCNLTIDGLVNASGIASANNTPTNYSVSNFNQGDHYWNVTCWDDLDNINTSETRSFTVELVIINLIDAYGLDSTLTRIDNFNTTNLEEIEYMELNFSVDASSNVDSWYLNFTANGTSGCSLGNKQSSVCYYYDNSTYRWIHFVNNTNTSTYDATQGNQGDRIIETKTGSGSSINLIYRLDEHYNPNVFKWYDALYNFSDVKWQSGANQQITKNQLIKIAINENIVPLNADQYKLDFRVNYTTGGNLPGQPLEAYLCNSTYSTGLPENFAGCALVTQKLSSELQDDGTKFRGVFTKNLIDTIGDAKYVILKTDVTQQSKYYYIKTYKATAAGYTTHWNYSTDNGATWANLADGYETEMNINWFYNGADPTEFIYSLWANSTDGDEKYLQGNVTWNIDAAQNYPPLANLINPSQNETLTQPYTVTFATADPNDDNLNASLLLYYGATLNKTLATGMNQSNTTYLWDDSTADGTYDLVLLACELGTTDLFCVNDTHEITIDNTKPSVVLNTPIDDYNTSSTDINFNWTANNGIDPVLDCNLTIDGSVNATDVSSTAGSATNYSVADFNDGVHYWNVTCVDDLANVNTSLTRSFTVDTVAPYVILNTPIDDYNTSDTLINFNWTAVDAGHSSVDCNLTIDSSVNASGISSANNTPTNYSVAGFDDGSHYWNVTCIDDHSNVNTSDTRMFTVDATKPSVVLNTPIDDYNTSS
ncbi:hypothetical protein ACFL0W_06275, partial [Nanoarchaeota archaeon]